MVRRNMNVGRRISNVRSSAARTQNTMRTTVRSQAPNVRSNVRTGHRTRDTGLSRGRFLRTAGVGAAAVGAAAAGLGGVAHATNGTVHEVYPTGNPSIDIPAVAGTVGGAASGDTVLLKATNSSGNPTAFNLWTYLYPCAIVAKSLTLQGETTEDGAMTTVIGGTRPVLVHSAGYPVFDVAIQGIHFVNAKEFSIVVSGSRNLTIKDNKFTADTMEGKVYPNPNVNYKYTGWAIFAGLMPGGIVGEVCIENNYIDLEEDLDPNQEPGDPGYCTFGIDVRYTAPTSKVLIANNTIHNVSSRGVMCLDNRGSLDIVDNIIETGPFGGYLHGPEDYSAAGIVVANGWATAPSTSGIVNIFRNTITAHSENKIGIVLQGLLGSTISEGSSIVKNNITGHDCWFGIHLFDASGVSVVQNNVTGNYDHFVLGIGRGGDRYPSPTDNNTFVANNIAQADSGVDVELASDAHNNVLVGFSGTVADFSEPGSNNLITGFEPVSGGVGSHMSNVIDGGGPLVEIDEDEIPQE